ncbi:HD domain-containing protein [Microbulbifer hydrolyticus]|uniref:HD domain-containing protein n=1 Tax=Microbulbifer hydrolyticus TaxID=48074 RepID=A0A6P1T653_9GAMM|nr:HD domain-containing protein [Microbulbifer hydrolyticus]MBB5210959.1 putative HD phosphohydrolase [Microbulbifer hydrolyticus]QHQ38228.1 HD domain-containing protein [Microbulbifer hydrolyticus]
MYDYLLSLLYDLDGVQQNPKYHPEGDALFHSLQAFEIARSNSLEPILWASALVHDVGKAVESHGHEHIGAEMLQGVLCEDIVWLVQHHLDLMTAPRRTRHRFAGDPRLPLLQKLRQFDVQGRDPNATTMSPEQALLLLKPFHSLIAA